MAGARGTDHVVGNMPTRQWGLHNCPLKESEPSPVHSEEPELSPRQKWDG